MSAQKNSKAFFITGTGTGIGKTFVTATLTHQLHKKNISIKALKPIITGWDNNDHSLDTFQLLKAQGLSIDSKNINSISPFRYSMPLSPDIAAEREEKTLSYDSVFQWIEQNVASKGITLIEGAGGVAVPLENKRTMGDLAADLQLPTFLIAGSYLGAISHTITSAEYLLQKNCQLECIIVSASTSSVLEPADLQARLEYHTGVPVFYLPRVKNSHENQTQLWQSAGQIPTPLWELLTHE